LATQPAAARGKKIPDGVNLTLRQMPSQAQFKQRSLFDFLRLFDHVFKFTNHPKPFSAEAVAKFALPALTNQPGPRLLASGV